MTVARQGVLALRVNKLALCHLPVATVTGPGEPLVSSSTEEIAACDSIPWPGPTVLPQVGRIRAGRPFAEASMPAPRYVMEVERRCEYTGPTGRTRAPSRHRCGRRNGSD